VTVLANPTPLCLNKLIKHDFVKSLTEQGTLNFRNVHLQYEDPFPLSVKLYYTCLLLICYICPYLHSLHMRCQYCKLFHRFLQKHVILSGELL